MQDNIKSVTKNLLGLRFNRLTILEFDGYKVNSNNKNIAYWKAQCDCGKIVSLSSNTVTKGNTKSCGCLQKEYQDLRRLSESSRAVRGTYSGMLQRCYNIKSSSYQYYGANGVTVCDRWREPMPQGFINFCEDMGERPKGCTLDRIKVNGNYEPSNCRWADESMQKFNQNTSVRNTSGKVGVYFENDKWRARIRNNDKLVCLGLFSEFQDAVDAREKAELKYYGFIKGKNL